MSFRVSGCFGFPVSWGCKVMFLRVELPSPVFGVVSCLLWLEVLRSVETF